MTSAPKPADKDDLLAIFKATKARVAAGQVIGMVCTGTKCKACGEQNWGHRMGCRCTKMTEPQQIEWGVLVDRGLKEGEIAEFMTIEQVISTGLPLVDLYSGAIVPIEPGANHE